MYMYMYVYVFMCVRLIAMHGIEITCYMYLIAR